MGGGQSLLTMQRDAMEGRTMKKTVQGPHGAEQLDRHKAQKWKELQYRVEWILRFFWKWMSNFIATFRPFSTCSKWQTRTRSAASLIQGPERGTGRHRKLPKSHISLSTPGTCCQQQGEHGSARTGWRADRSSSARSPSASTESPAQGHRELGVGCLGGAAGAGWILRERTGPAARTVTGGG